MAVYFTSSVPNGNTEEVSTERIAQYSTRKNEYSGETEHVIYIRNIGEFTGSTLAELGRVFGQVHGMIGLEMFKESKRVADGNSGSH